MIDGFGSRIHNSRREILEDLIAAARKTYLETTVAQVTVHLGSVRIQLTKQQSYWAMY